MRILGIDPGLRLTGYGCVEVGDGPGRSSLARGPSLVEGGVLRLDARLPVAVRLHQLFDDLDDVFGSLVPDLVVVEKLFTHYQHVRTAIQMGHARGVVLLVAQRRSIEIDELAATEVKKAITGHGHASKEQIQRVVMVQCGLPEPPQPPDVADAIAVALCAAWRRAHSVPPCPGGPLPSISALRSA
jgi:crossover junction endodeoxyribonuclease RuvC